jgi:probable beta-1,3-galactosyltransferase
LIFFEESLLPQKITQRLDKDCQVSINATINHHESRVSLYDWLKKKFYYGKSLSIYQKKVQEL